MFVRSVYKTLVGLGENERDFVLLDIGGSFVVDDGLEELPLGLVDFQWRSQIWGCLTCVTT